MQEKSNRKKLKLNKETVRKLNDGELKQVAGGRSAGTVCDGPTSPVICCCINTSAGPSHPIFC